MLHCLPWPCKDHRTILERENGNDDLLKFLRRRVTLKLSRFPTSGRTFNPKLAISSESVAIQTFQLYLSAESYLLFHQTKIFVYHSSRMKCGRAFSQNISARSAAEGDLSKKGTVLLQRKVPAIG